jgi:transketolase
VLWVLADIDGPAYCRVLRGEVPAQFDTPPTFGRLRRLVSGNDVCVVSSSVATGEAIKAVSALERSGVSVCHFHAWTLKPFDDPGLPEALEASSGVVTVENHLVAGGLGTAVAETMARHQIAKPFVKLGLQDTYAQGGTQPYLLHRYGLSAEHIIRAVEDVLGAETGAVTGVSGIP